MPVIWPFTQFPEFHDTRTHMHVLKMILEAFKGLSQDFICVGTLWHFIVIAAQSCYNRFTYHGVSRVESSLVLAEGSAFFMRGRGRDRMGLRAIAFSVYCRCTCQ